MKGAELKAFIAECESELRAGRAQSVARKLNHLHFKKLPREYRLPLAKIARRAGCVALGLKLLTPVAKNEISKPQPAELSEYAQLLQRSGVIEGARAVLTSLDFNKVPQAGLHLAYSYFSTWDYEPAIPLIQKYLTAETEDYARLVAEVNLAAAYVLTARDEEALSLIAAILPRLQAVGAARLAANAYELRSEVSIRAREFAKARADLERAALILGSERTHDQLFIRKGLAVAEAFERGRPAVLDQIRFEAAERGEWETVRDLDLNRLKLSYDSGLHHHIYFGTPFPAYRSIVDRELGLEMGSSYYQWGPPASPCLDLSTGEFQGKPMFQPAGSVHRLAGLLCRDLYRPQPVGALFAGLFPGEHFDIFTSPNRVHQVLKRARLTLSPTPFIMEAKAGTYRLVVKENVSVLLPRDYRTPGKNEMYIKDLINRLPRHRSFTSQDVCESLAIGKTLANQIIHWAEQHGKIQRSGRGRGTRYRLSAA